MIEVQSAPAFATVQDGGRNGWRSSGVPPGGAMDLLSLQTGNALLGNSLNAPALEWALTGGTLRFRRDTGIALTGATCEVLLNSAPIAPYTAVTIAAGDVLEVRRISEGRFLYLCVDGGIDVPEVLGGRGTYLPAGFGGLEGRRIRTGDVIRIGAHRSGHWRQIDIPGELRTATDSTHVRILRGPQASVLDPEDLPDLEVASESDRAGFRLLTSRGGARYTAAARSEPACTGAVQLTPDGNLIVLMPDGPTVAGYPKIAVVISADIPRLAQKRPGTLVRFQLVEMAEARSVTTAQAAAVRRVASLTTPDTPR